MGTDTALLTAWASIAIGFLSGMIMGLVYLDDSRLGGYGSKARRYIRLGHIASVALGILVILAVLCTKLGFAVPPRSLSLLVVGMFTMPISCWITAFHEKGFLLFPIPSFALFAGVVLMIVRHLGGFYVVS